MTVSVSNTNINDSFNSWRLNTNFAATVLSNNVVTVARAGSANRGGVAKGNGHIAGTFTANELRTVLLKSGNTSSEGGWIQIASNTSINATSLTVTANTTFQGNVDFVTSGTDRLILGDISRIRVTGGTAGQFLRMDGGSDTPNFKSLTLRDITDLSSNSAHIILSGSNSTFSDNADSPHLKFSGNTDIISMFLAADIPGDSDLQIVLADSAGDSRIAIADSGNNVVAWIDSDGNIVSTVAFLPSADDAVDLGSSGAEFRNLYIDGVANIDELSVATGASQGVSTSLIPKTDAVGNLGSTTRKWGTVWADTTNGGAGVFSSLGVSGAFTANGTATFNGGFSLTGDVDIGNETSDTLTVTAQVDSDFDPQTGTQRDMGSTDNRWHNVYANNMVANNVNVDNDATIEGNLTVNGTTTIGSGQILVADSSVFTTLGVLGQFTANGNVDLGNATTDSITVTGQFDSALIPITDDTYDLGTATKQWQDIWIDGTASIDTLQVDETITVTGDATFNGDNLTIAGNTAITDSLDVGDSIDVTNNITNDGTVIVSKNGKIHANNAITAKTITTTMIANTMTSGGNFGSATQIPIFQVNDRGQIIGVSETNVAGVSGLTYTQSNNNIRISTADGSTFDDTIDVAGNGTAVKGVASFQAGEFSLSSGHVSLADTANGAVLAISGTANEVNVSRSNGTVTVGLPDDVTVTGQLNVGENIVVSGNLIVSGTTTTVNSETVNIADNIVVLNSNETGTPSQNGGIEVERGTSTNVRLLWNETSDYWQVDGQTYSGRLITTGDLSSGGELANFMTVANTQALVGARLGATATVTLTGDVTGTASFSGNSVSISTTYNNDVVLGTDTSGNYVATIATGTGLNGSSSTEGGTPTITLDLNELTTSTTDGDGDYFIVVDTGGSQRKLTKGNIAVSGFDTTNGIALGTDTTGNYVGTITAGTGLSSTGATSGEGVTHTISLDSDLRGAVEYIGLDSSDYIRFVNNSQIEFEVNGGERFRIENDGDIHADGDVIAYSTTISDERLKEDVTVVENALEKVSKLRGVEFTYTPDGKRSAGLIAQEVESVLPQAVSEKALPLKMGDSDTKYKVLQYDQTIALLVESIKELKAEIDELKKNK